MCEAAIELYELLEHLIGGIVMIIDMVAPEGCLTMGEEIALRLSDNLRRGEQLIVIVHFTYHRMIIMRMFSC